jgi:hypothetical protein
LQYDATPGCLLSLEISFQEIPEVLRYTDANLSEGKFVHASLYYSGGCATSSCKSPGTEGCKSTFNVQSAPPLSVSFQALADSRHGHLLIAKNPQSVCFPLLGDNPNI